MRLGKVLKNGVPTSLTLICPDLSRFVEYYTKTNCPEACHGNGFCSAGKCLCYDGYDENNNC